MQKKNRVIGTLTYIMYGKFWCDFDFKLFETERQRGAPPVPVAFTKDVFSFLDRM